MAQRGSVSHDAGVLGRQVELVVVVEADEVLVDVLPLGRGHVVGVERVLVHDHHAGVN